MSKDDEEYNLGNLYLQKRSQTNNNQDVVIINNYARLLKPFQIHGIRFLHSKYLQGNGAILNDEDTLGKTVQIVLFLSATQSDKSKQSLILCNESKQYHWLYHFHKWTTLKATISNNDFTQCSVVISSVNNNYNIVNKQKWNVIVIDNLEPITYVKYIQNAKCSFKIWLADKNLKNNIKEIHKILQWISNNKLGTLKSFESMFNIDDDSSLKQSWKRRQLLNFFCNKWLIRRTMQDVENELPFFDIQNYKSEFQDWLTSYNSNKTNPDATKTSITTDNSLQTENSELLEDEAPMESSPSLLDLSFRSDLENDINKRKSERDVSGLIIKKSRSNDTDIAAVDQNAIEQCENPKTTSLEKSKDIKTENDSEVLDNHEYFIYKELDDEPHCSKLLAESNDECEHKIKIETEDSQKYHLLDSLFSSKNKMKKQKSDLKAPNMQCEKVEENPYHNMNIAASTSKITDSDKKSFKLLDRFFS